jgi:hypothetical protein
MLIKTGISGGTKKYFDKSYLVGAYNGRNTLDITKKSESILYALVGSSGSSWYVPSDVYWPGKDNFVPDENKKVEIRIPIRNVVSGLLLDSYFDFENVRYYNSSVINGDSVYQKTNTFFLEQTLTSCFLKTGLLKEWNQQYTRFTENNIELLSIRLTRIKKGDYKISSNMKLIEDVKRNIYINNECTITNVPVSPGYTGHHYNGFWNPSNYFDYLSSNFKSMIIEEYSLSSRAIDNFKYYDIVCNIKPTNSLGYYSEIFSSFDLNDKLELIKKGTDLADFNIISITKNYPTVWNSLENKFENLKPTISNFSLEPKSIKRQFTFDFSEGYKTYDSNYLERTFFDGSGSTYLNSIGESWNRTYENYIPNKSLSTTYKFNDDYYYTLSGSEYPFDFGLTPSRVPIQVLTNQPNFKKLNKKWEVLSFLNNNYFSDYYGLLRIPSKLSINVKSGDDVLYSDLIDCTAPVDQPHDSDFLTFKTDRWNTATQSVDRIQIDYLYGLQNPGTSSTDIGYITYSQTYYRDPLDTSCSGLEEDDDITTIMFKNSFGVFDIFEFEETSEFNLDRKIDIFTKAPTWRDDKTSIFDSILKMDLTKTYKTTTRILDDDEWVWLEELVRSNDVYVVVDETPYPIIITDISYGSQKNVDKKIAMTWRFSRPE